MSESRCDFEQRFAAEHGETPKKLGGQGWHSAKRDREWHAVCVPPGTPPAKRAEILAGYADPVLFGELPPCDGAAGGAA